jgi:helicase
MGRDVANILQKFVPGDNLDYFARCKRAAILFDWINGISVEEIERNFSTTLFQGRITYGDIQRFADATRFHLRSAHQILCLVFIEKGAEGEQFETLFKQIEFGIPGKALDLLNLRVNLNRGQHIELIRNNIETTEAFWNASLDLIRQIIGKDAAERVERIRPKKTHQDVTESVPV